MIPLPENFPQEEAHNEQGKAPIIPKRRKKIPIQEDDEDDEEEEYKPRKGGKSEGPINTYFPVHFGSTSGGAIAIANAYSTGKGGQAASRATAYGSPASSKKRTSSSS